MIGKIGMMIKSIYIGCKTKDDCLQTSDLLLNIYAFHSIEENQGMIHSLNLMMHLYYFLVVVECNELRKHRFVIRPLDQCHLNQKLKYKMKIKEERQMVFILKIARGQISLFHCSEKHGENVRSISKQDMPGHICILFLFQTN